MIRDSGLLSSGHPLYTPFTCNSLRLRLYNFIPQTLFQIRSVVHLDLYGRQRQNQLLWSADMTFAKACYEHRLARRPEDRKKQKQSPESTHRVESAHFCKG